MTVALLDTLRVVSLTHFHAGPMAAQILGDLGADVIAIEPLTGASQRNWAVANHYVAGQSVGFLTTGRNKKSLALDLKSGEGREIARRLLETADVGMDNFRPGTMDKLGLGYEALASANPGLVYACMTGFGGGGPYRDRPGQDLLLQAMTGLAARTGSAKGPPTPVGPVVVDQHAAVIAAMSIMAALVERSRTGKGQVVECSLFQAALDLQSESLTAWMNGARGSGSRGKDGLAAWFSPAPYGIHATADGYMAVSIAQPSVLAAAFDLPQFAGLDGDALFSRAQEITRAVSQRLAGRTTAQWLEILTAHGIWHSEIRDYEDLREDPQVKHLGMFETMEGSNGAPVSLLMHPARYGGEAPTVRLAPQRLGAQTSEILAGLGYSPDEIADLAGRGVVLCDRERQDA